LTPFWVLAILILPSGETKIAAQARERIGCLIYFVINEFTGEANFRQLGVRLRNGGVRG